MHHPYLSGQQSGLDRPGQPSGLIRIDWIGPARLHVAESAFTGADVPENHDRRMFGGPALTDVGAGGLFADRVESKRANEIAGLEVAG